MRLVVLLVAVLVASSLHAQDVTIRPVARNPVEQATQSVSLIRPQARQTNLQAEPAVVIARTAQQHPIPRPYEKPLLQRNAVSDPQVRAEQNLFAFSPTAPVLSLRPSGRTAGFVQVMADRQAVIVQGQVCGDPAIQGDAVGVVEGRGACGIESAVRLRSVAGVQITPNATIDCPTAQALKTWITNGVQPATGGQAASLRVVSHYACRNRNSAASGRLSEHSFGRAIDIAGIGLKDGREITVLTGWNTARDGAALRQMWQAACGPFGTVLGPEANRFHRDHFHFDTARYRSGSYCR